MKTQLLFLLVLVAVLTTAATVDKTVAKHNLVKVEPLEGRNGALVVYSSATEKLQFFLFDVEGDWCATWRLFRLKKRLKVCIKAVTCSASSKTMKRLKKEPY